MKKLLKITALLSIVMLISGCWDLIEIDRNFFISAIGIDLYKGEEHSHEEAEEEDGIGELDRYVITYVAPDLRSIGKNATSDQTRIIMSTVSNNPYEATRELTTRTNRNINFRHTKAVIIGEEVARNSDYLKEIFDNLARHEQLSRKISVLIAQGTAKEVIETEDQYDDLTGQHINELVNKKQGSPRYNDLFLEEVFTEIFFSQDCILPRVVVGKGEIKVAGSAVIKDFKLIGWLGEVENISVMFLLNRVKSALVNASYKGAVIPYIITNSDTKYKIETKGDKIKYIVDITTEGYIQQFKLETEDKLSTNKTILEIEAKTDEVLEKQISETFNKLQKEFKTDALGVGRYISKHEPELWKQIEDDWDEIFENMEFEVNVDTIVRRIGMTK